MDENNEYEYDFDEEEYIDEVVPERERTYKLNFETGRIVGTTEDSEEIIKQNIKCALRTPLHKYGIYSFFGTDMSAVDEGGEDKFSQLTMAINTAVCNVEGVESVENVEYMQKGDAVVVTLDVLTQSGERIEEEVEYE